MYLCGSGHDEVAHINSTCPVCELKEEIKLFKKTIEDLEEKISDMRSE